MAPSTWMLGAAGLAVAAVSPIAGASVFYTRDFQNGSTYSEWSTNQHYTVAPTFTRFLGRCGNETMTLTLPTPADYHRPQAGVPSPDRLLLEFHLYIIDSWDGNEPTLGIDYFNVRVNGVDIFDETFANQHTDQSYPHDPDVGRTQLGFDQRWVDSIYYMSMPFEVQTNTFSVAFRGHGLQVLNDESWGIDNVRLSVVQVPAPGAIALVGAGTLCLVTRRRRK